jgi:UDP-N-acetylglucosamine--N-acetylmuramyl-(pentapeptide) pyrophosphoryl-undecaprenol N-acetylglucosamine transferase
MAKPLHVVMAAGGSGGHVYPGLAVARELLARRPDARISFVGTARGIESGVIPREGFELDLLHSAGLKGKSMADRARAAALIPVGLLDAWRIVSKRRPDIVIGVGGYSSGPIVLVAALRRVKTMVISPDAVPGLANRVLAPFVDAAAINFESSASYFGSKAFVSGHPIRLEFLAPAGSHEESERDEQASVTRVLVFGGSQGAHAINVAMVEAAPRLAADGASLRVVHQTGERDVEMVRAGYREAGLQADVEPFLFDMERRLRQADVIVCRAGMTTLAEIEAVGKAAILIPLPTAADDHQRKNAEALVAAGAAELLLQRDASGDALADRVLALAHDTERRRRMGDTARSLARPDAAKVIVDRALELTERAG